MFHFKKFSIDDSTAAMKIGTDAVLLGAWVSCKTEIRILDIGAGSGILSLMMAQRNKNAPIDAVESEPRAAALAQQNVKLSPWADQIKVFNKSIQNFHINSSNKYSLVICNPPFFSDSLKSPVNERNTARHNDTLPVTDLLKITSEILTEKGKAAFIIPTDPYETWRTEAAKLFLFPERITWVKSSPLHKPHRVLIMFTSAGKRDLTENEIIIYSSKSVYSNEYKDLTKDFYLNF